MKHIQSHILYIGMILLLLGITGCRKHSLNNQNVKKEKQEIQKELNELIAAYYDGSFSPMACDYIRTTGMTQEEVAELEKTIRQEMINIG